MKSLIFILACVAGIAAGARASDFIWIEGESPQAGNFPAADNNPFRPQEFWEQDILSGGKWIGMKWNDGDPLKPFLVYQFQADETGDYDFYARKFYNFGNFRWKVNNGPWHEADSLEHTPLDIVSMREGEERISVNWFFIGNAQLKAGTNTLRIEPIRFLPAVRDNSFTPLAYDTFLFTRDLFFPDGKLKPGEGEQVQNSSSFAPRLSIDSFEPCDIDWRMLNEKFAGENGGLVVKDGGFAFRDTGEQVRLMGMNVSPAVLKNPRTVAHLARFLAKKGINLVRMDFSQAVTFERDPGGRPAARTSGELLEKLAAGAAAFKNEGIYLALTWNIHASKGWENLVGNMPKLEDASALGSLAPWLLFDQELQSVCRSVWKSVLDTPLPGGGVRLGGDPALAFITLNQQDTIFADGFQPYDLIPEKQMEVIERAFGDWLASRENTRDLAGLLARWGEGSVRGDAPAEGRVGLLSAAEMATRRDTRSAVTARFLAETQKAFLDRLQSYLRDDLGYRGILSTSNKSVSSPGALGWINAWSLGGGDVVERHGNYLPYFENKLNVWQASVGARYSDRSALRFDPLPGRESERFDLPIRSLIYPGKPVFFSEISWPLPNRFRPEMVPVATTLAALQGVDALCFNVINFPFWQSSLSSERTPAFTPAVMGQMPAFAYAFRRNLLPEGAMVAALDISDASLFALKSMPLHENGDTQMTASLFSGQAQDIDPAAGVPPSLWINGGIEVRLGAKEDRFEMMQSVQPDATVHEAAGGAVKWDHAAGVLRVDAPACKAVCGFLKNAGPMELDGVEFTSGMEFGTICLVALDGQPLAMSKKMLLQVFSEETNSGAYAEGNEIKTIRSTGQPPILVKNMSGTVRFLRPDASQLIFTALDFNGGRTVTAGTGGNLSLLPATAYYLVEK